MAFHTWSSRIPCALLFAALALYGCSSERTEEQGRQSSKEDANSSTKAVRKETGEASWYGPGFNERETASGETFDQKEMTAAHPSLPMGTTAKITNLENGKKVEVKINDRGPYAKDRVIDLSSGAANKLDMKKDGTAQVKIETKSTGKKRHDDTRQ